MVERFDLSRFRERRQELIVEQILRATRRQMAKVIGHVGCEVTLHPSKAIQHEVAFPIPVIPFGPRKCMFEAKGMSQFMRDCAVVLAGKFPQTIRPVFGDAAILVSEGRFPEGLVVKLWDRHPCIGLF